MNKEASQAVVRQDVVYITDQLPADGETLAQRTYRTLKKIENELDKCSSGKQNIFKVNIYVPDHAVWTSLQQTYRNFFGMNQPEKSVIPTNDQNSPISFEVFAQKNRYYAC